MATCRGVLDQSPSRNQPACGNSPKSEVNVVGTAWTSLASEEIDSNIAEGLGGGATAVASTAAATAAATGVQEELRGV